MSEPTANVPQIGLFADNSELGVDPQVLWEAADKLRGSIDAAEYKHVVLGLIFVKYISDSFDARRQKLQSELEAEGRLVRHGDDAAVETGIAEL